MPIEAAVKIVLDLGYDLGNNPALSDYKKAFINAINDLDSKDPRIPILQQAVLAVKRTQAVGFVNGKSVGGGGKLAKTKPSTGLSPSALKGRGDSSDISSKLSVIEGNLQSILDVFRSQFNLDKKKAERDRKAQEEAVKKGREDKLESTGASSGAAPGSKILQRATKPVQGFLDKLLNFFKNILMGGALLGLLKIIENPDIILQPVKDFIDGLSKFFNKILKVVFDIVFFPINALIAGINMGIRGVLGALDGAIRLFNPEHKSSDEFPQIPYLEAPQIPLFSKEKEEEDPITASEQKSTEMPTATTKDEVMFPTGPGGFRGFNSGGMVGGRGNRDSVAAMLTPGEVVMSKPAVDYWGADNLLSMNRQGGGTNMPTSEGGFQGGGKVSRYSGGVKSKATIGAPSNTIVLPPSPTGHKVTVIPIPLPKKKKPLDSGASSSQKDVTPFSAKDLNNMEMLAIQSQYSIVG